MEPIRIGILRDAFPGGHDVGGNVTNLIVDDVNAQGGLHGRPLELVVKSVDGRTMGTHGNVEASVALWEGLAGDETVLGIIGASTTPVAVALHERIEAARIPEIHWAGTDRACGEWHFQFQAGYLPDEGPALAYLLARRSHRRVVCVRSEGDYGADYLHPFIRAAEGNGFEILGEIVVPLGIEHLDGQVKEARALNPDALVAMGLFGVGPKLGAEIKAQDWRVACFGNCGFALMAAHSDEMRSALTGWIATDLFDPRNTIATELLDRYGKTFGIRPMSATACFARDLAVLMIEGLRRTPELSRHGLREGLEAVRDIPAATGGAGTRMGFGPRDRLALKGPRIFTFSEVTADGLRPVDA